MSDYIETPLTLDSLDLIQIETLLKNRVKELVDFKTNAANNGEGLGWYMENIANEQIANYRSTLKKIKAARQEIKRIKSEADAAFYARLNAAGRKTKSGSKS